MQTARPLTKRELKVVAYLKEHLAEEDRLPTTRELAAHFGWRSATSGVLLFKILVAKGVLEARGDKERKHYRFVRTP